MRFMNLRARIASRRSTCFAITFVLGIGGCGPGARVVNEQVTRENLDRIEMGMTAEQVEEILGPGEPAQPLDLLPGESRAGFEWFVWVRDSGDRGAERILVGFGPADDRASIMRHSKRE